MRTKAQRPRDAAPNDGGTRRTCRAGASPSGASSLNERFYHPELDILRFGAFFMVYLWHSLPATPDTYARLGLPGPVPALVAGALRGGAYGVDLFFALSSYLITELLLREHRLRGSIDIKAFYTRRILRIWPLYLTFLIFGTVILQALDPEQRFGWKYYLAFLFFAGNWACAIWGFPASSAGPLWSVSIEEQFYLSWPLIVKHFRKRLPLICTGLIACATATRLVLIWCNVPHPGIWCNTLARVDPIAGGALLAVLLNGKVPRLSPAIRIGMVSGGIASIVLAGRYGDFEGPGALGAYPAATAASLLMICGVLSQPQATAYGLLMRAGIYLGRISYGLYVFHVAAIRFTVVPSSSGARWAWNIVSSLALTMALAAVSYRFIESPFLRLKNKFSYIASTPAIEPAQVATAAGAGGQPAFVESLSALSEAVRVTEFGLDREGCVDTNNRMRNS